MYRILIVEDDAGIAEAVSEQAKMWNFETHSVTNFRNVMAEFAEFDPHLVLMDIGLPFFNGYYWCGEIRKVSRVPVIFICFEEPMILQRQSMFCNAGRRFLM